MASELGISDSVVQTDGLVTEHWELVPIYNAADLYVLPSSYEGFSLPILEAMACGIPVLTTNRAALAEIASGYALLVDDLTVEALSDAMARALNDPQLRQHLRARGLERARSFRWEDTARRTLELLRKVAHA
jgi:glycosyltransferase involved in cell wall biosynthesis